jgi:hypothetical protein
MAGPVTLTVNATAATVAGSVNHVHRRGNH